MKWTNNRPLVAGGDLDSIAAVACFDQGVQAVMATRCEKHKDVKPLNAAAEDGSECPVCLLHTGPPVVHQQRYAVSCQACGFTAQGTLSEFESARWEQEQSLGSDAKFTCAACLLGLTRAEPPTP